MSTSVLNQLLDHIPEDHTFEISPDEKLNGGHSVRTWDMTIIGLTIFMDPEDTNRLLEAWRTDALPLAELIPLKPTYSLECDYCGERKFATDGLKIIAVNQCPHPEGIQVEFDLEIPSGRMIVGNDLRPEFDVDDSLECNINASYGIAEMVEAMAANKAAYMFVGNSCPSICKTGDNSFSIVAGATDDNGKRIESLGEEVAAVCTDLWWVTIVDGDEYDRRGCERDVTEVKVTPGTYTFRYNYLRKDWIEDYNAPTIYATFELKA